MGSGDGENGNWGGSFLGNRLVDALFDEDRDILVLASEELEIVKINQSASIFFGVPADSLMGHHAGSILDSRDQARLAAVTALLSIDGETIQTHLAVTDYLGVERQLAASIRYIRCDACQRSYFLFVIRRDQPRSGKSYSYIDPEVFIRRLLKGLSDSAIFVDVMSRTIDDCNIAAESLFGYSRGELLGRSPQFLAANAEYAKEYIARSRESYARTGFYQETMLCRKKDGSLFKTLATNIAFFGKSGEHQYTMAINRDMSQEERRLDDIFRLSEQSRRILETLSDSLLPLKSAVPSESLGGLGFSERQIEIAAILLEGEPTKAIAARLKVSESAIKSHLSAMYRRAGVASRMEFIKYLHDRQIRIE